MIQNIWQEQQLLSKKIRCVEAKNILALLINDYVLFVGINIFRQSSISRADAFKCRQWGLVKSNFWPSLTQSSFTFNLILPCHHSPLSPFSLVTILPCHHYPLSPFTLVTILPCHHYPLSPFTLVTILPCHHYPLSPFSLVTIPPCHHCPLPHLRYYHLKNLWAENMPTFDASNIF